MRKTLNALFVIVAMASAAIAAEKPNFSGQWKINVGASNFGPMPASASYVRKVNHDGSTITMEDVDGPAGASYTWKYVTDGKAKVYKTKGLDVQSVAGWEGDAIALAAKVAGDFEFAFHGKMALSSDKKSLTYTVHVATEQGEFDVVYVFDKQ